MFCTIPLFVFYFTAECEKGKPEKETANIPGKGEADCGHPCPFMVAVVKWGMQGTNSSRTVLSWVAVAFRGARGPLLRSVGARMHRHAEALGRKGKATSLHHTAFYRLPFSHHCWETRASQVTALL